jgi:hypothetical protein
VFTLHSGMTPLDFLTEPSFECADDDSIDVVFIHFACLIGGRDAAEEYLVCRMSPLSANFSFTEIADGETLVSKVVYPCQTFPSPGFREKMMIIFWQGWNLT